MKLEELEEKLYEAWFTLDELSEAGGDAVDFGLNDPIDFFESNL